MKLNGIKKIDESKGKYLVLCDYGCEGIAVVEQYQTLDDAVRDVCERSGPCSIVTLVEIGELS